MINNELIRQLTNRARLRLTRFRQPTCSMTTSMSQQLTQERESFQDVLPTIIDSLAKNPNLSQIPEVGSWVKQLLDYNLGGDKSRGLATVYAYERLEKPQNITEDSLKRARIMGWCVEMLQAVYRIIDDVMDSSSTRYGKPCWYRRPKIGLGAINDAVLIKCSMYETLRTNFRSLPMYADILELFNQTTLLSVMGQHLDHTMSMAQRSKSDYSLFTIERYCAIVKHKTSYYSFNLPISLGYLLANNILEENIRKKLDAACEDLGNYLQIQDDYLDCYGDVSETGKIGTDIQEGKCSWLAVNALKHCNDHQKTIFIQNYADKDPAKVETIKRLYNELGIPELYKQEEKRLYNGITQKMNALPANACLLDSKLFGPMFKRLH